MKSGAVKEAETKPSVNANASVNDTPKAPVQSGAVAPANMAIWTAREAMEVEVLFFWDGDLKFCKKIVKGEELGLLSSRRRFEGSIEIFLDNEPLNINNINNAGIN